MKLALIGEELCDNGVALHGGTWIETPLRFCRVPNAHASPFTEGRGLKPLVVENRFVAERVALHGGAWIETYTFAVTHGAGGGRPSRRGVD